MTPDQVSEVAQAIEFSLQVGMILAAGVALFTRSAFDLARDLLHVWRAMRRARRLRRRRSIEVQA